MKRFLYMALLFSMKPVFVPAQPLSWNEARKLIDNKSIRTESRVIEWRRDFHQHPELGNREFRTAGIVAKHLEALGLEVQTGIAGTGVVGILKGGLPGPVVALRADMDALPVTEELDLPFASKVRTLMDGQEVGVMHACGHDAHTAILMGVAEVIVSFRDRLPGTVKFIFQPAEEGVEDAGCWGAELMIREGVLKNPEPDVIFGLHVWPMEAGKIGFRPGPLMASVDNFEITVTGRGTHGAIPWAGVDPVIAASQIVLSLQTIVSRNVALNEGGAVLTVGSIHGGNRSNIVPDQVAMKGTMRAHNEKARTVLHGKLREIAENVAKAAGATATVEIDSLYPPTINDEMITRSMISVLKQAAGDDRVEEIHPVMPAEDFSYFLNEIPGMYFFLGILPSQTDLKTIEANHSPRFYLEESAFITGLKSLAYMTVSFLLTNQKN